MLSFRITTLLGSVDCQSSRTSVVFSCIALLSITIMCSVRKNTLVIDFTVLPVRPDIRTVQQFLEKEINLQYSHVESIQLHHARNCVLIEMKSFDIASRYQLDNNCKRTMLCAGKEFCIPVYVDCDAVTVRIHDLPLSMDNSVIGDYMLKYGEVISIRNDTWKHYFSGLPNGVRVLRMRLLRDIPSYITIENERTMVSYLTQPKLCHQCGQPAHPKEKCSSPSSSMSNKSTLSPSDGLFNETDFPPINNTNAEPSPAVNKPTSEEHTTQNNDDWTDVEDNASSTSSGDFNVVTHKRRRSTKQKDNVTKKVCSEQGSANTGHNAAAVDSPSEEKNVLPKNKNRKGVTLPIYNTK